MSRSSNSPRYLVPATRAPRSRATISLLLRPSGTSPSTMRRASPSTIAVLPTPGSPIRTGLFLVRRERTWITRRISSSRPITGSSLPRRAISVRLRAYFSKAWKESSGFCETTRWLPRIALSASSTLPLVAPASRSKSAAAPRPSRQARSRCSTETKSSRKPSARRSAESSSARMRSPGWGLAPPSTRGPASSLSPKRVFRRSTSAPIRPSRTGTSPPSWVNRARSRCSGVISAWPSSSAAAWAACKASCDFTVSRSRFISGVAPRHFGYI